MFEGTVMVKTFVRIFEYLIRGEEAVRPLRLFRTKAITTCGYYFFQNTEVFLKHNYKFLIL